MQMVISRVRDNYLVTYGPERHFEEAFQCLSSEKLSDYLSGLGATKSAITAAQREIEVSGTAHIMI